MSPKPSGNTAIDQYLNELENEELAPWEQDQKAQDTEDWFEQVAADFLAKPAIDPTLEEILEATKAFTRKNFALRAGLLYRQQLQNTPDYETVLALEPDLVRLAGEANCLAEAVADPTIPEQEVEEAREAYKKELVHWAVQVLMPKLEGSKVVKVTRSTKKAKNILAQCAPQLVAQLGMKYKALLEQRIEQSAIYHPLANSVPGCAVREWLGAYTGRETAPSAVLINLLWSKQEQRQWLYGLVEYATELIELVAHAKRLDPDLRPTKYLCYFQKKSEATLYRGQEELEAMIKNMQADKLLPTYQGTGGVDEDMAPWEKPSEEEPVELDPPAVAPPAIAPKPEPKPAKEPTLAERLRAKRLGLS